MGVGDGSSFYRCFVSLYLFFWNGVSDFLSIFVFRQVCEGVAPIAISIWCDRFRLNDFTIRQEVDSNGSWAQTILVVLIFPDLVYLDRGCTWFIGIGNGDISIFNSSYGSGVSLYFWDFFDGVDDVFFVCLLSESCPSMCPLVISSQGYRFAQLFTVSIELNLDSFRTFTVLIVLVIPSLGYCEAGLTRCIAIGDIVLIVGCSVAFNSVFCHSIDDFFSVSVLR